MSEAKHTPGSWTTQQLTGDYDETRRFAVFSDRQETDYCRANPRIAVVEWIEAGEGEANARLIAAAPELLNVCKRIRLALQWAEPDDKMTPDEMVEILDVAIAKAAP